MRWWVAAGVLVVGCLPPEEEDDDVVDGTVAGASETAVVPVTSGMVSATSPEQAESPSSTGDAEISGTASGVASDATDDGEASTTGATSGIATLTAGSPTSEADATTAAPTTQGDTSSEAETTDSGSPGACELFAPDLCGDCINAGCCETTETCRADPECDLCLRNDAACTPGPAFEAFLACVEGTCRAPCAFGDFGMGTTVEACQGVARYSGEVGGLRPTVTTGFALSSEQAGTEIWLDSRPFIPSLAELPADGDWAVGIVPTASTDEESTYEVDVVVGQFDGTAELYRQVGASEAAFMLLLDFSGTDDTEGLLCHGRAVGLVEAVFESDGPISSAEFSVPLLTPDFPSTAEQRRAPLGLGVGLSLPRNRPIERSRFAIGP